MAHCGHHAEPDRHLFQQPEVLCNHVRGLGLVGYVLKMRQHRATEFAQQDAPSLAVKQLSAEGGTALNDRAGLPYHRVTEALDLRP